jgi:hypothetical protein
MFRRELVQLLKITGLSCRFRHAEPGQGANYRILTVKYGGPWPAFVGSGARQK